MDDLICHAIVNLKPQVSSQKIGEIAFDLICDITKWQRKVVSEAITTCNKPDGFDLQSFKEILGID
jgi:hypothetical protein